MPRRHLCDVEGCTRERQRWQRLCAVCYGRLSGHRDIRYGILDAHRTGQRRVKRQLARRAGAVLGYTGRPDEQPAPIAQPPREPWWLRD